MTIEPDPTLTGAAFDLASAGYAPMGDPDKKPERDAIGRGGASLRDAASQLSEDNQPVMVREYVDAEGKPAASNEAIALTRAERDHARVRAAEKPTSENEHAEAPTRQVDRSRAPVRANDPSADEFGGVDLPERQAAQPLNDDPEG